MSAKRTPEQLDDAVNNILKLKDDPQWSKILNNLKDIQLLVEVLRRYPNYSELLTQTNLDKISLYLDRYSSVITAENKDKWLLFSYTNLQEEVWAKMNMFGVISFMFQKITEHGLEDTDGYVKKESDLPEEIINERKIIHKFLMNIFKYDPDKHVKAAYAEFKDKEINLQNKKFILPKEVLNNIPSADIFSAYNRYFELYFNEIYGLTYKAFSLTPALDFAINPYFMGTKQEVEEFQKKYEKELKVKCHEVKSGPWTCIAPFRQNRSNVKYCIDQEDAKYIDVNKMMDSTQYDKLRNDFIKQHAKKMQDKADLTDKDKEAIKTMGENMGHSDIVNMALEDKGELPDDAVEYKTIIHDCATGEIKTGSYYSKEII